MNQFQSLDEALEFSKGTEKRIGLDENTNNFNPVQDEDILQTTPLFFPRKILKVSQIQSGNWPAKAWFIDERTNKRALELDAPTEESHLALTSGFRSCVIRGPNGFYTRIKGVSKPVFKTTQILKQGEAEWIGGKGMAHFEECLNEHLNTIYLISQGFPYVQQIPTFIEAHPHFTEKNPNVLFKKFKNSPLPLSIRIKIIGDNLDFEEYSRRYCEYEKQNMNLHNGNEFRLVSGYIINSDTRLDEAAYHLTKKQLSFEKEILRDICLDYLFFKAGKAKAALTSFDMTFGDNHLRTNNHPGNYVIGSLEGNIEVGICDLSELKRKEEFSSIKRFDKFALEEMMSMRDDLMTNLTCSFGSDVNYRHFSRESKERCFNAFHTGYEIVMLDVAKRNQLIYTPTIPNEIITPLIDPMSELEFRETIKQINN